MNTRNIVISLSLLLLSGLLVSCVGPGGGTKSGSGSESGPFLVSSVERDTTPDVSPGEIDAVVRGNTRFAFDMYKRLIGDNENLIFSPYSMSTALAMTYGGAEGQAKQDMATVLHFDVPDEQLHAAFNQLDLTLSSLGGEANEDSGQPFTLRVANSLWCGQEFTLNPDFLDLIGRNYGGGVGTLDFPGDREGSARVVNQWISDQTEGRITDALSPDSIDERTALLLVNAIYFLANWADQFIEERTEDQPFHLLSGDDVTVPLMANSMDAMYYEGEGYQAVTMFYVGYGASMLVILPEADRFEEFEQTIDADLISTIMSGMRSRSVELYLPRFEFETRLKLEDTLKAMGMESAFESGFESMFMGPLPGPAHIDEVIHQAMVAVDESGTEAAAVTIVEIAVESMPSEPEPPVEFRADHPFIFLIMEESTDSVLFVGRVLDPS